MPHAPVLIPEVGGARGREAAATTRALRSVSVALVQQAPDALVVVSPHAPRRSGCFGVWTGRILAGELSRFGRPEVGLELPNATELVETLAATFGQNRLATWRIPEQGLDHGSMVPLYYIHRAGWRGPTAVISLNEPGEGGWRQAGEGIGGAAGRLGRRVAIVASGDMSHRLRPGAPAGYEPRAREFDDEFVRILRAGRYDSLHRLDPELQARAAEDVVDSTLIAAHAVGMDSTGHEVLSYEGPFGVGYCVATLFKQEVAAHPGRWLPRIARASVEGCFRGPAEPLQPPEDEYLGRPAGVFVTLRTRNGQLRGCRGTIHPRCRNVVDETREVARASAFDDLRFGPVTEREVDGLTYEVSVLHPPEPVAVLAELDPRRYGMIVSTRDGRRGLMLPGVEGLDTVEQQLAATCQKARIDQHEPWVIERFTADKFTED